MVALALAAMAFALLPARSGPPTENRPTGLFTTLPILWRESEDLSGLLATDVPPHWALAALRGRGRLVPLDALRAVPPGLGLLVIAQPRPLSPEENVALDAWVRAGGHVLLFADPMLTRPSAYPLGDRRRPLDTVLLSPILARWGLRLEFDEAQPAGERVAAALGAPLPVNLPGRFAALAGGDCRLRDAGLIARCRIGRGAVLALADAALLEDGTPDDAPARRAALESLLGAARRR